MVTFLIIGPCSTVELQIKKKLLTQNKAQLMSMFYDVWKKLQISWKYITKGK